MATVSAPYASGTITSVSGTTINLSGGAVAGWVGRCIRLSTGAGAGQTRKIATFVSATQITVDFAFANAYTRTSMVAFPDVDPAPGDGFVISHFISDFADATSVITDPGALSFRFVGASTFSGGVFIYAANARVDLTSSSIVCNQATQANRVAWRFGDIDSSGNVFNGCHLLDTATAPSGFGSGAASTFDPDFEFYGSIGRLTGAGPFWRLHTDNSERVRIIGSRFDGSIGGRMQGSRSIFDEWEVYNNQSVNGPFNAKSTFGSISNIRITQSLQAAYHFWPDSQTLEIEGIKLGPGVSRGVRFANTTTSGQRLTIKDIDINAWSALPNLYNNANGTYSNNFRISQYLDASYRNAAGTAIVETTRFVVRDNVPVAVHDATVTTGIMPRQTLRYRDMVILNTGNFTWASAGGTTFAPYQVAACSYNNQPSTASLPLLTSQSVTLLALVDSYVTQTNKATVDAYAAIDNLDQLYDRCKSWTVDNLSVANPSFGAQVANGNGTELNLGGFNLVVDNSAPQAFLVSGSTVTIKASTLVQGSKFQTLRTTGSLTLLNGATMGISYTTGAGSFAAISVTGLQAGSRVQIYNVTDASELYNGVVAGTSYSAIFPYTGADTIRVRVAKIGYLPWLGTATNLPGGISFTVSQVADTVYATNGIDGSLVTGITPDNLNLHLDLSEADGVLEVPTIYAYTCYLETTAGGIADFFDCITAEDAYNYRINIALLLDNVNPTRVQIVDGRLYRADGANIIAATSGPIHVYETRKGVVLGLGTVEATLGRIEPNTGLIPALL